MNWTLQILGGAPDALWTPGAWLAGNKRRIGWLIVVAANFVWMAFAAYIASWTLLFWSGVGALVTFRNWWKWGRA